MGVAAALVAGVVLLVNASSAQAIIVYVCGSPAELCRINSGGSNRVVLTSDGARAAYQDVSLDPSGSRGVFSREYESTFAVDGTGKHVVGPIATNGVVPRISADGTRLVEDDDLTSVNPMFNFGIFICIYPTNGSTTSTCGGEGALYPTFAPNGEVVASVQNLGLRYAACVYDITGTPSTSGCARTVASSASDDIVQPAVSPDGRTLAVTVKAPGASAGHIALYNMSTGQLVRNLTSGSEDAGAAWSPDSTRIVFSRGDSLYVISAAGGNPRLLTTGGLTPTWGGPDMVNAPTVRRLAMVRSIVGSGQAVQVRVTLSQKGNVIIKLERVLGRRGHVRNRSLGSVMRVGHRSLNIFTIRRTGRRALAAGHYELVVTGELHGEKTASRTVSFSVRRG